MQTYAKALVAGLLAGLGALGTALLDNEIAPVEWVGIASATLTGLAVWRVPNQERDEVDRAIARADLQTGAGEIHNVRRRLPGEHRRQP